MKTMKGAKLGRKVKGFMAKAADEMRSRASTPSPVPEQQAPFVVVSEPNNKPNADTAAVTNSDQVLTEIMNDLKIGELAVKEMKSDEVSEYDGESAQVIEGDTTEESDDDEVAHRVDVVLAAAEEIRKKKNTDKSAAMSPKQLRKKEKKREAPEGRDEMNSAEADEIQGTTKSVRTKASKKSIKSKKSVKSVEEGLLSKVSSRSNEGGVSQEVGESESIGMSTMVSTDESTVDEPCFTKSESEAEDCTIATSAEEKDDTYTIRTNGRKEKKTVMNKDVIIHAPGGPENLVVRKMYYVPAPKDPEDVIIQVEVSNYLSRVRLIVLTFFLVSNRLTYLPHTYQASTVTVRDCLLCRGLGTDKAEYPFTPGCEIVGVITDLGGSAKLEGWRVGDRVIAFDHVKGGGNAKSVKVNMKCIAMISTTIDAASAACLADVYMSAYKAIRLGKKDGLPLTGKKVLVTDGFSPIGQAIVALAKLEGANIYVTTSNSKELEYMTKLGVKCFPFSPHKWLHKVVGKMDIVIDNTCIDSYESSWEAVSPDGMLVCTTGMTSIHNFKSEEYGESAGCCADTVGLDMPKFRSKWAAMKAKYLMSNTTFLDLTESAANDRKAYQQELKYLCFLVESGALVPKIAERVQIEEVADAHRYLETGKANGTIVCVPSRDKNQFLYMWVFMKIVVM